jgi:hypothetical protein
VLVGQTTTEAIIKCDLTDQTLPTTGQYRVVKVQNTHPKDHNLITAHRTKARALDPALRLIVQGDLAQVHHLARDRPQGLHDPLAVEEDKRNKKRRL